MENEPSSEPRILTEPDVVDLDDPETVSQSSIDAYDTKQLLEFFEKIVLPRDDSKMKKKLVETTAERCESDFNNSKVLFNLFLVEPNLVNML